MKQVGVLALQGAFIEHEKMLEQLGVSCIELRNNYQVNRMSASGTCRSITRHLQSASRTMDQQRLFGIIFYLRK